MGVVEGIGGIFIYSDRADELAEWYQSTLGIELECHPNGIGYYRVFPTRDAATSMLRENPVFAINHSDEPLAANDRRFVLNLRVDDLDAFLEQLRAKHVEIEPEILEWERGKHAWTSDPDGNRIELYEEIAPD